MFLIDSILFIEDSFYRDTLVWGFHTGEKKVMTAYARKGRGPGEVLSASSNIQYDGSMNHFRLYDVNSKKLIEYNTKNKNFAEYQLPYKDALFRENFVQELIKTDSGYLGMGTGSLFFNGETIPFIRRPVRTKKYLRGISPNRWHFPC